MTRVANIALAFIIAWGLLICWGAAITVTFRGPWIVALLVDPLVLALTAAVAATALEPRP